MRTLAHTQTITHERTRGSFGVIFKLYIAVSSMRLETDIKNVTEMERESVCVCVNRSSIRERMTEQTSPDQRKRGLQA